MSIQLENDVVDRLITVIWQTAL